MKHLLLVLPSRADFTAVLHEAWGVAETECWMVAAGVADFVVMLSPGRWAEEACEHDAADRRHVQDIVTHELVHTYHGQHNPTRDFTGADEVGWLAEAWSGRYRYGVSGRRPVPRRDVRARGALPAPRRDHAGRAARRVGRHGGPVAGPVGALGEAHWVSP